MRRSIPALTDAFGFGLAFVVASGVALACSKKPTPAPPAPAEVVPPRPNSVMLEAAWARPDEGWPTLRAALGPRGALLPSSAPLATGALLGLDPLTASTLDARVTAGLVLIWQESRALPIVSFGVENGPEFTARLSTGSAATHRVERLGELSLLVPRAGAGDVIGVADHVAVFGARVAVAEAGLYLARSPFRRAATPGAIQLQIPGSALRNTLVPLLRQRFSDSRAALMERANAAQQAYGRPADFGDPAAILSATQGLAEGLFGVLESAERAGGSLSWTEQRFHARLRLEAAPGSRAQSSAQHLPSGADALVTELPSTTSAALLVRLPTVTPSPSDDAKAPTDADAKALREVTSSWSAAAGPGFAFGLLPGPALVVRAEVKDRALAKRTIEQGVALLGRPPLLGPVSALLGKPTFQRSSSRLVGLSVDQVEVRSARAPDRRLSIASAVEERRLLLAAGLGAAAPLEAAALAMSEKSSLGDDAALAPYFADAQAAAWLLYVDAARLGTGQGKQPVSIALLARDGLPEVSSIWSSLAATSLLLQAMQ